MTGNPPTEAAPEPLASCDAAFSCLLQLRRQSGGNEIGAVQCRNVVNGETLSISRLIELAGDLGLKAEHARLDWQRLQALGFSHPLLALLKNTNVIVLTGGGRGGVSEVAVWDPLNPFEEILFVPREDFERAWTGHALIITTPPSNGIGTSPSLDFCWFTSAGLELLGKTSAGGQKPKPLVHKREKAGSRLKPTARRTPRQTDLAIAPDARGELDLARVELANAQRPPDTAEGAQPSTPALPRRAAERRLSPLVRLCIAAGAILAAAGIGAFLLRNSAADPVTAAVTLAKEVWAVAPNSAWSTDRRIASIPRTGSAPILAAPSATPAAVPDLAAPSATPADGHGLAASPAIPAGGHSLAVPAATPADGGQPRSARRRARRRRQPRGAPATPADGPAPQCPPPHPPTDADSQHPTPHLPTAAIWQHRLPSPPQPRRRRQPGSTATRPPPLVEHGAPSLAAAPTAPPHEPDVVVPTAELGLATTVKAPHVDTAAPPLTTGPRLSAEDMGALLARGDTLLSVGDVVSARLFYERAADAGGGVAAIRLGETFDPLFLDRVHLRGVRGDPGAALFWYRRARDLGVAEAEVLLKALEAE